MADRGRRGVLAKSCVCGHDHKTHRGESVGMCLDCSCIEYVPRCQNCGGETPYPRLVEDRDVCSLRCAAQLRYAESLEAA